MKKSFSGVGIAALAVVAMATGCSADNVKSAADTASSAVSSVANAAAKPAPAAPAKQAAPAEAPAGQAQAQEPQLVPAAAPDNRPYVTGPDGVRIYGTPVAQQPPAVETAAPIADAPAAGPCLDKNSPAVQNALATLGPDPRGNNFVAGEGTDATAPNCPDLEWVMAETSGGTGSSPEEVLFFHNGVFVMQASPRTTSFTQVVASSPKSVSVEYRWLAGSEPSCCPQGGPVTVTYTWDGSIVAKDRAVPEEAMAKS